MKPDKNDKTDKTDKTDKNVVKFINVLPDSPYARSFTLRGRGREFFKKGQFQGHLKQHNLEQSPG